MTGIPIRRAFCNCGTSFGTPGLTTISSWSRNVRSPCLPVSTTMPLSSSPGISPRNCSSAFASETVTLAPRACKNIDDATPDFPSPTTRTRFPLTSINSPCAHCATVHAASDIMCKECKQNSCWIQQHRQTLAQLQRRQCKQREDQRSDPEPHDDLRLRPAQQLEMMVQRRHLENALLPRLIRGHL